MSARTRLGRTAWKKPIIAVLAAALVLGSLAAVLLTRRAPPPEATPSQEPLSGNPATDDIPDAAPPPGVVRPGTAGGTPAAPTVRVLADQLLVKFEEGTPPGVVNCLLAKAGVTPRSRIDRTGTRVIGMPPARRAAALAVLASSPAVEYAESDVVLEQLGTVPNDPRWSDQWGPRKVSAPGAWDAARGSSSVVIAVLDTGVDFGHGDLRGAAAAGYDFVNGDSNPADDQGHGTAAAGVLAARTNNAVGLAGMCWACSLASVKVLDANGSGSTSTVARGIVWAADHGARVGRVGVVDDRVGDGRGRHQPQPPEKGLSQGCRSGSPRGEAHLQGRPETHPLHRQLQRHDDPARLGCKPAARVSHGARRDRSLRRQGERGAQGAVHAADHVPGMTRILFRLALTACPSPLMSVSEAGTPES